MKKVVYILGVLIVLFIFVLALSHKKIATIPISQRYNLPSGVSSAVAYGSNSFIYTNGQGLLGYNYSTGQVQSLSSSQDGLAGIDTVSASSDGYVLFHDQQLQQGGVLYNQLSNEGLDPTQSWWFVYSVNTQIFAPLPQNVVFAKLVGNYVYTLSPGVSNETLTTYSANGLNQVKSISVNGSINIFPNQSGFILQTPSNEVLSTNNGIVNQVLFKSASVVGIYQNDLYVVESKGSNHDLVVMNLANNKISNIATAVQNQPQWLDPGYILFASGKSISSPNIMEYNASNNTTKLWKLGSINNFGNYGPTINALVGPTTAIISDSSSDYFIVGNKLTNTISIN